MKYGHRKWVGLGMIKDRGLHKKFVDFSGLRFDKISPMDFDAFFEFKDELFVFVETKYNNAPLPLGQRLALERVCDAIQSPDQKAIVFITCHYDKGLDVDIDLAKTIVTQYRYKFEWHKPKQPITLFDAIERIRPK